MAVLINMVVFGRLVLRGFHDLAFIVMHIDASASITVLTSGAPKSQPMQLVWEAISERPEYQKLKRRLGAAHTFGPANLIADAASRNKVDVIDRISAQMRINSVQLPVPSLVKALISGISREILEVINQQDKVQHSDAPAKASALPQVLESKEPKDKPTRKGSLSQVGLYVSDGQDNNPDSASFADRPQISSAMINRLLSACELSLDIGQANASDSASFVMRQLLLQVGLPPVEITVSNLGPGDIPFGGSSTFRVDNVRKREMPQGDSGSRKKPAGLNGLTPVRSFNIAKEVRESSSSLSAYSLETVRGMTASLFSDKSPYALKLGIEPMIREAVPSLFALINDHLPSGTKSKNRSDWKWWKKNDCTFWYSSLAGRRASRSRLRSGR